MATAVDICNLALSHLGNKANVASIDPPDGSTEANWCARFYQQTLGRALEMEDWTFARKRATLALLDTNPSEVWAYAYAKPSDCLKPRRIITDLSVYREDDSAEYQLEGSTIYSNQADAVLIYTYPQTDAVKFPASFVDVMSYLLAAYLAGPILKGRDGANAAGDLRKIATTLAAEAAASDAENGERADYYTPASIRARNGINQSYPA
jgi:hypothetical protein